MFLACRQGAVAPNVHQKSMTNGCQNRWPNRLPLGSIFGAIFDGFSSQLGFQNRCKIFLKIDLKINSKIDTVLDGLLVALGSVLEAKLAPKSNKTSIINRLASWIDFLTHFWVEGAMQAMPHGGWLPIIHQDTMQRSIPVGNSNTPHRAARARWRIYAKLPINPMLPVYQSWELPKPTQEAPKIHPNSYHFLSWF